ncbi:MAG TPA: hypothetical protein VND98_05345, partial [Solirubrobacterales bacterium]|nr:hypothetical protein [Solirubrobacterales bacterium]
MRLRRKESSLGFVISVVVAIAASSAAIAYFSAAGVGQASASVSSLTAPTITEITPQVGGSVELSWTSVSGPGPSAVRYTVLRDGSAAVGNCPNNAEASTTCDDTGVEAGEHSYVVVAQWRTWSASSTPVKTNVEVGAPRYLSLTANNSTTTAGEASNLTVTALDKNSNVVPTYTGSHSLTFSGAASSPAGNAPTVSNSSGSAVAFGSATALTFSNGV